MRKNFVIILISCFFLFPALSQAETLDRWPVDFSAPETLLSSPFGPRLKASDNYRYDFHRGIDIPGVETDPVKAVKAGKVYRIYAAGDSTSPYPEGGNVVILRHEFSAPYIFQGETQKYYYTLYMHLASIDAALVLNQYLEAGTLLGYIGKTGDTDFTHLHFEIRVGTTCSLASACHKGYDPHINPLTFLPYPEKNLAAVNVYADGRDLSIQFSAPRAELDLNKLKAKAFSSRELLRERNLNFNKREGVDASSASALDTPEYKDILIAPEKFSARSAEYVLTITFKNMITPSADHLRISIEDVHDHELYSARLKIKSHPGESTSRGHSPKRPLSFY